MHIYIFCIYPYVCHLKNNITTIVIHSNLCFCASKSLYFLTLVYHAGFTCFFVGLSYLFVFSNLRVLVCSVPVSVKCLETNPSFMERLSEVGKEDGN